MSGLRKDRPQSTDYRHMQEWAILTDPQILIRRFQLNL